MTISTSRTGLALLAAQAAGTAGPAQGAALRRHWG
jgi:hypothetical protein